MNTSRRNCLETTIHGVLVEVFGCGILITGDSGTGKSELALELVSRGHFFIADDSVHLQRTATQTLQGGSPLFGAGCFMEIRSLGIVNIARLFGQHAVKPSTHLQLIVHLQQEDTVEKALQDRLNGNWAAARILGIELPEISLLLAPGRNLAVLLECAVRNYQLKLKGYTAAEEFMNWQQALLMQQGHST
ncbi:HPr kinase/phosphorylase [Candidatus Venteria ishoeyi]|uniref:HPr kinase/phosphorylase n=1 Tax=Candidatus Venteria ishoeyi TaxID=1899563 RepID=A0A1H6FC82_9GAMM|nr:HPr kinase/phosphorylase [Candidatus Venteria ishoeyi]MDM8545137.1 HPr kinase/phosphorylase [Candidatus Venteria ishoeyi]SEH06654.1 HPr kinase/phosphorylase [Candidatus Venteria ishoeyi]